MNEAMYMAHLLKPHVLELISLQEIAFAERNRVDKIVQSLLQENTYYNEDGDRVTNIRDTYMIRDADFERFHNDLNNIHLKNGYADAANGYCPACVAEEHQRMAERRLIQAASELLPDLTLQKLLLSNCYRQFIDLCIRLVKHSIKGEQKRALDS